MTTSASLIRMANQIARNHEHQPEEAAAKAVADHLRDFWSPSMLAALQVVAESSPESLSRLALAAARSLATG